uniref:Secreted protein n=1 Tax=Arundo donax TaxID=35708 RepID=A0A0A9H1B3_ARUDO
MSQRQSTMLSVLLILDMLLDVFLQSYIDHVLTVGVHKWFTEYKCNSLSINVIQSIFFCFQNHIFLCFLLVKDLFPD